MLKELALETKSADAAGLGLAFDDFMRAFEAFKDTNDRRLAEVERRMGADAVTEQKLDRIGRALDDHKRVVDDLAHKAARPRLDGAPHRAGYHSRERAAFDGYVRKGDTAGLLALEGKALSVGTGADGGYLVPPETEAAINRAVKDISPIRAIATVRQVSGSVLKKPFSLTGPGTGWVAETAARPETTTPTLAELSFPTGELYAMPAATQALLDDAAVDVDQWIAEEVRVAFAEQEGTAFVAGNGSNKPKGFLDYTKVANASWTWGNIGFITTGAAGAFPAAAPTDKLIDLAYTVRSGYRANASWAMSRATQSVIRKFKDADNNYIWQPSAKPGEPPTLLGQPVAESEDMPAIASDSYSIAFGDFRRGYLIVDRIGINVLRDPYSSKPYVLFYTTKRVGGGVQDFNAIKLLKFAA